MLTSLVLLKILRMRFLIKVSFVFLYHALTMKMTVVDGVDVKRNSTKEKKGWGNGSI